jgi:hypothetical protein
MNAAARFRGVQIIQFSLIAMPGVFAAVVYYLISQQQSKEAPMLYWLVFIGLVVAAGVASQVLHKTFIGKVNASMTLDQKLGIYTVAMLMRTAPWEGAALFASVLALVSSDPTLLIPYPVIATVMFMLRPTPESAKADLGLTLDETQRLTAG